MSSNTTENVTIDFSGAQYHEYRDSQVRTRVIIRSIGGLISVISSIVLIIMLRRSKKGFSSIAHRLLLGICISDIIYSLPYVLFNVHAPRENEYVSWNAKGNLTTMVLGYVINVFGMNCAWGYLASLNVHYYMLIRCEKNQSIQIKAEAYLHLIPIILSTIITAIFLFTKSINDLGGASWYGKNDILPHCQTEKDNNQEEFYIDGFDIPCGRGIYNLWYLLLANLILCFLVILISLGLIYRKLKSQETRNASYGLGSLRRSVINSLRSTADSSNERKACRGSLKSQSKAVAERAVLYTLAFSLAWIPLIITAFFMAFFGLDLSLSAFQVILYVHSVLNPLQGFYNLCIFMYPKVKAARNKRNGKTISRGRAILGEFESKKKSTKSSQSTMGVKQEVCPANTQMSESVYKQQKTLVRFDSEEEKKEICDAESLEPLPVQHIVRN
mmetsp:Transcript_8516/g.13125  ORF Transcript_8516/g.13125 Transcript_8516/m.13125 type:complete len:443 (-) Transcript_8516:142-1470(-)